MMHCDQKNSALLILRLTLGSIFILHGAQKVFGILGGPGLEAFVMWTNMLGVPPLLGYAAAFAEFVGGILIFTGIATELGAIMVIPVMLGAVFLVHWPNGYFVQNKGFEYPLNLTFLLVALIIGGPGCCALWDCFKKWRK